MRKKEKGYEVVLIYPKTGVDFGATVAPPHSLLAIAAPLQKEGYRVKIIDQRVNPLWEKELQDSITSDLICTGISCMTGTQIKHALRGASIIRKMTDGNIPIIWGGPHPSILPEQTLQNEHVDIVCIGEGDITILELVKALIEKRPLSEINGIAFKNGNNTVINPPRSLLDVEELLPVPWDLVDVEKYIHRDFYIRGVGRSLDIGQTSRGCPYMCGFCVSASLRQRKWRPMSSDKSLERIIQPVKDFRLDSVWIRDDEFYIDRRRADRICQGIIDSGIKIKWYTSGTRVDVFNKATDEQILLLKRSGADTLKFGAESGSNRILKLMNKGITWQETVQANLKAKRCGITPAFALMIGFPTETFDEIHETIDLFIRLKKDNEQAQFEVISPYTAFPGTPLYALALEHGLRPPDTLEGWIDWLCDEYDLEGRKMPWYNYKERKSIGNIAYMSIIANSMPNAINGISNTLLRLMLKTAFKPISAFERMKLKNKWYSFCLELDIARYLRKKIFYQSDRSIH